jgi:hypothetical protein
MTTPEPKVAVELTQAELVALLNGATVATSLVLNAPLPTFYNFSDPRYGHFVEAQRKLHEGLAQLMGLT